MSTTRYVKINCCADCPHLDREDYDYCYLMSARIKESYGNVYEQIVLDCSLPLQKDIRGKRKRKLYGFKKIEHLPEHITNACYVITKDGHTMFPDDVIKRLNELEEFFSKAKSAAQN